jgi:hypothetical protein
MIIESKFHENGKFGLLIWQENKQTAAIQVEILDFFQKAGAAGEFQTCVDKYWAG